MHVVGSLATTIVVPQRVDKFDQRDGTCLCCDRPVASRRRRPGASIFSMKLNIGPAAAFFAVMQSHHQAQMLLHVSLSDDAECHARHPHQQRRRSRCHHEDHPEPDKQKDLLVRGWSAEHIGPTRAARNCRVVKYWSRRLHRDSWKAWWIAPVRLDFGGDADFFHGSWIIFQHSLALRDRYNLTFSRTSQQL